MTNNISCEETMDEYAERLTRFAKQNPRSTEADLKDLIPRAESAAAIFARFNGAKRKDN